MTCMASWALVTYPCSILSLLTGSSRRHEQHRLFFPIDLKVVQPTNGPLWRYEFPRGRHGLYAARRKQPVLGTKENSPVLERSSSRVNRSVLPAAQAMGTVGFRLHKTTIQATQDNHECQIDLATAHLSPTIHDHHGLNIDLLRGVQPRDNPTTKPPRAQTLNSHLETPPDLEL
jgi:hypothetical protein